MVHSRYRNNDGARFAVDGRRTLPEKRAPWALVSWGCTEIAPTVPRGPSPQDTEGTKLCA